ncbi:hypothetical protein C8Q72DRAFT_891767 [Fomitopsis betulina]|nr:hypothetical protein C8Q72DRAFT_891767 [Fomitopsis betulina]
MAKSKSSASSATRKKHARKAATGQVDEPQLPKEKKAGKKEKKSKVPRKKVYIPPIKPAPVRPDPLDTLGIAQKLPPELLVILRRFAKKTRSPTPRAGGFPLGLGGQGTELSWTARCDSRDFASLLHHVPALFLHPSRRIRLLSVGLHSSLLRLLSEQLFFNLREVLTVDEAEYILGSWLLAAHDIDRQHLWDFVHRTLLDPGGCQGKPSKKAIDEDTGRARSEEEEENEADRRARLRMGACGSAEWMLNTMASERPEALRADFVTPFANPALWSVLYHAQNAPFVDVESFGWNQPGVRRAAWSLLQVVLAKCQGDIDPLLQVLSSAILRSAWVEPDPNDDEGDEENEDEDGQPREAHAHDSAAPRVPSAAYREFLQFLELGCSGSPLQGYPTVIVIISTIPPSIFGSSSSTPLDDLFTSFWAAVDGRLFTVAWEALSSAILAASGGQDGTISPIASTILKSFQRAFEQGSEQDTAVKGLVAKMDALVGVLNALEGSIFSDKVVAQSIDDTIRDHLRRVLDVAPSLLLSTFVTAMMTAVLKAVARSPTPRPLPDFKKKSTEEVVGILEKKVSATIERYQAIFDKKYLFESLLGDSQRALHRFADQLNWVSDNFDKANHHRILDTAGAASQAV